MSDKEFLNKYEELLNKDYCNCNEMNCIDNNSPRRILNIAKSQQDEIERLNNIINELKERSLQYSEEIDRLLDIKEEIRKYIMTELISEWDIENDGYVSGSDLPVDAITPILEILDKES